MAIPGLCRARRGILVLRIFDDRDRASCTARGFPNLNFDLQPHLQGELVLLRPLMPNDWSDLFAVASDPLIWEQHPANDRHQEPVFRLFFQEALDSGGAFAIIDRSTGGIIGSTRFHAVEGDDAAIEIGWTFLARSHWGGRFNHEAKRLMLDHAFRFVERVIFIVGENNIRSQTAVQRIGGVRPPGMDGFIDKPNRHGQMVRNARFVIHRPPQKTDMRNTAR